MKFGETLRQRSIPQWAHYNVDYDELKHLIKERTTSTKAIPVSIRPQRNDITTQSDELEDELFLYLTDQHERVTLFAKSKFGEIERRLKHLSRQLQQIGKRSGSTPQRRLVQQSRRFQKLVADAEAIGEDTQSLSRYTNTQKIAFKKILKKYQKWTGSSKLAIRMNNQVFNHPSSFLEPDFTPLLAQLTRIQATLREVSTKTTDEAVKYLKRSHCSVSKSADGVDNLDSSTHIIGKVFETGAPLDIDAALSTTSLGPKGGRAIYWVHPDNVAELRVLLLRHMREHNLNHSPPLSRTPSALSIGSRHGSVSAQTGYVEEVLFDNLEAFVKDQNAATLNRTEDTRGSCALRVLMQTCWIEGMRMATVSAADSPNLEVGDDAFSCRIQYVKTRQVRRKDLHVLHDRALTADAEAQQSASINEIRQWIEHHPDVQPLVHIRSRRERFDGLHNDEVRGVWAVLQEEISMKKPDRTGPFSSSNFERSATMFPYLVLSIRWEGQRSPEIVNTLNGSYLVERVPGFSTHTHAIYTMCASRTTTKPLWLSLMQKDIRKVPPQQSKSSSKRNVDASVHSSKATSASDRSTDGPSGSGFSAGNMQSSATSIDHIWTGGVEDGPFPDLSPKKSKLRNDPNRGNYVQQPIQRYWNEFDNGSDNDGNDVYTIYVDPNVPVSFPGYGTLSNASVLVRDAARASKDKINSWLSFKKGDETEPLLAGRSPPDSQGTDDSSDSDPEQLIRRSTPRAPRTKGHRRHRSWSTQRGRQRSREAGLFRAYVGCFVTAFILLAMTYILRSTGRHKAKLEVDVGVLIGGVGSMCFDIIGLSMMFLRKEKLSWLHRITVSFVFSCVCVGSGILLAFIGKAG